MGPTAGTPDGASVKPPPPGGGAEALRLSRCSGEVAGSRRDGALCQGRPSKAEGGVGGPSGQPLEVLGAWSVWRRGATWRGGKEGSGDGTEICAFPGASDRAVAGLRALAWWA